MTDAGSPAEWAEFLDAMAAHPNLAERVLILPGNHDLNIVDRANPARMDLPTSPNRRLRQLRVLSAMDELQGDRVRVVELGRGRIGKTLAEFLEPHVKKMARFANEAKPLLSYALPELWAKVFPLVLPPDSRKTASASSCSTPMPTRISPSPTRSAWCRPSRSAASRSPPSNIRAPAGSSRCITTPSNIRVPRRRSPSASARR